MAYVVVDTQTGCRVIHPRSRKETWDTERGAKVAVTRISKMLPDLGPLVVMDVITYRAQVPMREVTNLMTGEKVLIRADRVGGVSDPSTESYWSL